MIQCVLLQSTDRIQTTNQKCVDNRNKVNRVVGKGANGAVLQLITCSEWDCKSVQRVSCGVHNEDALG